jgi:hypothetical protein
MLQGLPLQCLIHCFRFSTNCRFVWDEGKYPTMSPLKEIVGTIQSQVAKIEDDMKVRQLYVSETFRLAYSGICLTWCM